MLKLRLIDPEKLIPSAHVAAEAASRGIEVLIIGHLRKKNDATSPRAGFPKSNYYAKASNTVSSQASGNVARVEVDYPGVAMHYEGGTVYPKKKALAIPLDPAVAGIWPSEVPGDLDVFWPKNSAHGFLKDPATSDLLYLLVPKATIPADPSVLPSDGEILSAAEDAVWEAVS